MKHTMKRALALLLALILTLGIVPPSQAAAEEPPMVSEAAEAPAATAGEAPFLPVEEPVAFVTKPTLSVRFLEGDGSDKTKAYPMTNHDYVTATWKEGGTIQITLQADGSQTNRKLSIDLHPWMYIISHTDAASISTGGLGVATEIFNGSNNLVYSLPDGNAVTVTITITFRGLSNEATYPKQKFPLNVDYTATDAGVEKSVFVSRAASTLVVRDVPSETIVTKYYETLDHGYIKKDDFKNQPQPISSFLPFYRNSQGQIEPHHFIDAKDLPPIHAMQMVVHLSDLDVLISGAKDYMNNNYGTVTSLDNGDYKLVIPIRINFTVWAPRAPVIQIEAQKKSGTTVNYGDVCTMTVVSFSFLGEDKDGPTHREYKQQLPTSWNIQRTIKAAPKPPTVEVYKESINSTLYFNAKSDKQKLKDNSILGCSLKYAVEAEEEALKDPKITVDLPDGLAPTATLGVWPSYISQNPELSYDNGANWVAVTPTSEDSYWNIPLTDSSNPKPNSAATNVRFSPTFSSNNNNIYLSFRNAYGSVYRDSSPIKDKDERPFKVHITAGNLAALPANSAEGKITYEEYIPPIMENRIYFSDDYNGAFGNSPSVSDQKALLCSDGKKNTYSGQVHIRNYGDADATITHNNAVIRLKAEKYAKLLSAYYSSSISGPCLSATYHLSDGREETLTAGMERFRAPEGLTILWADFTIEKLPVERGSALGYLRYDYFLPPEMLAEEDKDANKEYFSVEFISSNEVPAWTSGAAYPKWMISKNIFYGLQQTTEQLPRIYANNASVGDSVTQGGIVSAWAPSFYFYTRPVGYKNTAFYETLQPTFAMAMKINKNFTYVNGSMEFPDNPDVVPTVTYLPNYFPDGDSLVRITNIAKGFLRVPTFRLAANIDAPAGSIAPISKSWVGGDFSKMAAANNQIKPDDDIKGCDVRYSYTPLDTESALDFDLNGDGVKGGTQASAVAQVLDGRTITVNELKQEGIFSYGSGVENNVEGAGPYYGAATDTFTYRTFLLAQQQRAFTDLVMYIPIPRANKAPTSSTAKNQWDAALSGVSGKVIDSINKGETKYTLSYSTVEAPTMLELSGGASDNGYTTYTANSTPDWSKVTMLKIKSASVPIDTGDDLELSFACNGTKPAGAVSNHMETYFRYSVVRAGSSDPVFVSGPTTSIYYTLASNSVSGTVYLDGTYDGALNDMATSDDKPLENVAVTLYNQLNQAVKTVQTDAAGHYVIEAPNTGKYSIGVATTQSATRLLLPKGNGSTVDAASGRSDLFDVTRSGVSNINVGYRDKKSFTLYSDAGHTNEITDATTLDLAVGTDFTIHQVCSPDYLTTSGLSYGESIPGKLVQIPSGKETMTLRGTAITAADETITMTVTMDDGFGTQISKTFKLRVLPSPVLASFEGELNYYTEQLYQKDTLLGGTVFKNCSEAEAAHVKANFHPTEMWLVNPNGTKVDKTANFVGESHKFTEADIGKYEIIYEGTDSYGRPVVDSAGNSRLVRTIYMHGYPYLKNNSPLHSRVGAGFDPKKEADGIAWLTAGHKHANADGTISTDEVFSAKDGEVTLAYYKMYSTDGTNTLGTETLTAVPAAPGKYEVYYYVRMRNSGAYLVHRTLYMHGAPGMYVPTVIAMKPDANCAQGTPINIDYAAQNVWTHDQLKMYDLVHVNENGSLVTYNRSSTRFFLSNGKELTSGLTGTNVIASPTDGTYNSLPTNIFIKEGADGIKNAPGVYHVTMAFRDTLDNMGKGTVGAWDENKKFAYNANNGMGYIEMPVDVVITTGNQPPVLPNPAGMVFNFVEGDDLKFTNVTASPPTDLAAQLKKGSIKKYEYDDGKIEYYKADKNGALTLADMLKIQLEYKSHDLDIHELKPGGGSGLSDENYKALHAQAVTFLWDSITLTQISTATPGQEGDTVVENPTADQVAALASQVGSHTLTFTADDVRIEAVTDANKGNMPDDTHKLLHNYWIIRDSKTQSTQTYHFYVHSDVSFTRTDGPLVSYGLHTPQSGIHAEMPMVASFVGGKLMQPVSLAVTSQTPDISAAHTAPPVIYKTSHIVMSTLPSNREAAREYKGTAFVNEKVQLSYASGGKSGNFPAELRRLTTDADYDLSTNVSAALNGYANFVEPPLAELGTTLTTATWTENQSVPLELFDSVNLHDPLANKMLSSNVPCSKTIVYRAEDKGTNKNHPYHTGKNVATASIRFVFDTPIFFAFGGAVSGAENARTMSVLRSATDGEISAILAPLATVTYGETPSVPTALATSVKVTRDGAGAPTSVTVTATDKSGRTKTETISIVTKLPPIIRLSLENENGNPLGITLPDITNGVIGSSYTVFAPYVSGYLLAAGQPAAKTILVKEGTNTVQFRYEKIAPAQKPTTYTVQCLFENTSVQSNTFGGVVGQTVTQGAVADFVKGSYKYTLKKGEATSQSLTLDADASKNLISFNYDRTEVPGTGGGGGGTVVVNYYAVNYITGEYGVLNGDPAEQVKEGTKPQNVPTVTGKTGYTFKGWFLETPEKLLDPAQQVVNKTLSFYAAYTDKDGNLITGEKIPALNKSKHFAYLHGDNYGNVNGDKPMSRAEVVVIFSRLLAKAMPDDLQLSSKFTDVPQLSWYAPAVAYMEQFGIIDGYEDGSFHPEAPISRAELVAIASRFERLELTQTAKFSDVPPEHWAAVYISSAAQKGWISGYADGTFRPANSITRAEAVCVINALLDRQPDEAFIAGAKNLMVFPDLPKTHWAYSQLMEATNEHSFNKNGNKEQWLPPQK